MPADRNKLLFALAREVWPNASQEARLERLRDMCGGSVSGATDGQFAAARRRLMQMRDAQRDAAFAAPRVVGTPQSFASIEHRRFIDARFAELKWDRGTRRHWLLSRHKISDLFDPKQLTNEQADMITKELQAALARAGSRTSPRREHDARATGGNG